MVRKNLVFRINMILNIPEDWNIEDTIDYVKTMMLEDGLSEYINEDNLIEYD